MSHRVHGHHHLHDHKHTHKLSEHDWLKLMKHKGLVTELNPGSHGPHEKVTAKYHVFKIVDGVKELVKVDEHGEIVD